MITILHGEHIAASRAKLVELLEELKQSGAAIERIEAKKLDRAQLEMVLAAQDLFGNQRTVIIEGLHSLPRSTKKNELIELIANSPVPVVLWEQRDLTPTMIKQFGNATTYHFKVTKTIFSWLDSLSGDAKAGEKSVKLFHQALTEEDAQFLFVMLARQVRLLIQAKDNGVIKGPPFMVSKLKKQASTFSLDQLLKTHRHLLECDLRFKTSTNVLTMTQELDLLQLNM